jgi:carboxypeptidase C (cathepsin A)
MTRDRDIAKYLNRPEIKDLLGVDSYFDSRNMTNGNWDVNAAFHASGDTLHSSYHNVASLLEHGVKVLVYAGKTDWMCNHVANEKWAMNLDWSGKEAFHRAGKGEWFTEANPESKAGEIRSHGGLTFLTIENAGHFVSQSSDCGS